MMQTRSQPVWQRSVLEALVVLFLFVISLGRAADSKALETDDSGDGIAMLESMLEADDETPLAQPVRPSLATNALAVLRSALQVSNGKLTAPLRVAYLDWAQATVLTNLAAANCPVPRDCLAEVLSNATLRDAMFAAIYPPDPSILQNYAQLHSQLGADFLKKYRALVVGVAVAKRRGSLLGASGLAPPPPAPRKKKARAAEDEQFVQAVAEFMRQNSVAALDLYQNADKREQLASMLSAKGFGVRQVAAAKDPGRLFGTLKDAMVRLGQRPAAREALPSTAAWLRHLAAIYEATPASRPPRKKGGGTMPWPLFPMDRAPWPLLMPMARPMPLGEAQYIWETFQGQHGGQRYHTYGPYRGPEGQRPRELLPSAWHWNAWPDRIVHGGVCVTMASIAMDTHSALCEPSVGAGQPHHANLIGFKAVDDLWNAVIEQAFAGGPPATHAAWPFRDFEQTPVRLSKKGAGSEYHLGLAQAMNVGLSKYINTRIAVNLFHTLPEAERTTLGTRLLTDATQLNPFNPEPWYLLAHQTPDAARGSAFAKYVIQTAGRAHFRPEAEAPRNASLENFVEVEHPKPIENQIHSYWRTLGEYLTRFALLRHPVPQDAVTAHQIYTFLKTEAPGISAADQMPYRLRLEGGTAVKFALLSHVRQHLQAKGKNFKKGEKAFAAELEAFLRQTNPAEREPFLATLRGLFPPAAAQDPYLQAINATAVKIRKKKR